MAMKHLDYEPTDKVALDLIPIHLALTNLEYFIPVTEAKAHLHVAHKSPINKDKTGAKKHLEAVDHSLVYTEVDLPLAATEHHLGIAQELLADKKPRKADAALEEAEAGVEFISLSVGAPIVHAKKSLWQGMEAYAAGNVEAGKIDLNQAGVWLTHAMQTRDKEVKAEATALAGELRTLAADTKSQGSAIKIALQGLWRKIKALTEREAAQAVVGWQDFGNKARPTCPSRTPQNSKWTSRMRSFT
ncbi:MAG: YfdX family protein [Nitrospirales bacterium]|nr:YfdX family protein [Nitrospirales bacterium]